MDLLLQIAIELSRRDVQGRSFPNSTSEDVLGDDDDSDDDRLDLHGNASLENGTSDQEEQEAASHSEAQVSNSRVTSREVIDPGGHSDQESDATDISGDHDAANLADESGGHAIDDVDNEDDDDDTSVSSSILLQSDDEVNYFCQYL